MKLGPSFILSFIVFSFLSISLLGQNFSRVKVELKNKTLKEIAALGIEIDHGIVKKGSYIINDFSDLELAKLKIHGFEYRVIIDDVSKYYASQNDYTQVRSEFATCDEKKFQFETPKNYTYGSMGGYHTYSELLEVLDAMHDQYPNLITKRQAIDTFLTEEGRPIYYLKISNHPRNSDNKPKVLYTALHHAREPASLSQMIFYMWYLLENYEKNEEVKFIVDSTSLYFVPCINPDGYVYNERNNPNGGGLWRKNRRVVDGDTSGVDLNRNYGFEWHFDDIGSSSNKNSNTYRGEEAFSEPETRALRALTERHNFEIALNYHSYGNLMVYPWGFNDGATPEDLTFKGFAEAMTKSNNYQAGTPTETVGYTVNGSSDDHMYGEHGIFAFTPEVGSPFAGFWPPKEDIEILNKSVLEQNLIAAKIVHSYVHVDNVPLNEEASFAFALKKYSLDSDSFKISVQSLTEDVLVQEESQGVFIDHLQEKSFVFPYSLNTDPEFIPEAKVVFSIHHRSFTSKDTFLIPISTEQFDILFADSAATKNAWSSVEWDVTNQKAFEGEYALTDSPLGNYAASSNSTLTLKESIDLSEVKSAELSYFATWEIEEDFDYAQVRISTNGIDFEPLCGLFTENGTAFQDHEQPIYDGKQDEWVREVINLDDFLGEEIWIQFALISDEIEQQDGFYVDEIQVEVQNQLASNVKEVINLNDEDFRIVPNPFFRDIHIVQSSDKSYDIRIYDQLGRRVGENNLAPGIYYVEVWQDHTKIKTLKGVSLND